MLPEKIFSRPLYTMNKNMISYDTFVLYMKEGGVVNGDGGGIYIYFIIYTLWLFQYYNKISSTTFTIAILMHEKRRKTIKYLPNSIIIVAGCVNIRNTYTYLEYNVILRIYKKDIRDIDLSLYTMVFRVRFFPFNLNKRF